MTTLRFFYEQGAGRLAEHEAVITMAVNKLKTELSLPDYLEVCLYTLTPGIWGGIDHQRANRLALDRNISLTQILPLLVHELVHVDQQHRGVLQRQGLEWWWQNQLWFQKWPQHLTNEAYLALPWEIDARTRTSDLIKKLVKVS